MGRDRNLRLKEPRATMFKVDKLLALQCGHCIFILAIAKLNKRIQVFLHPPSRFWTWGCKKLDGGNRLTGIFNKNKCKAAVDEIKRIQLKIESNGTKPVKIRRAVSNLRLIFRRTVLTWSVVAPSENRDCRIAKLQAETCAH